MFEIHGFRGGDKERMGGVVGGTWSSVDSGMAIGRGEVVLWFMFGSVGCLVVLVKKYDVV